MNINDVKDVIHLARSERSFTIRIIFSLEAEIFNVRRFVSLFGAACEHHIGIDDETMMRLRVVAIKRRWRKDTDRIVVITLNDNFDEHQFLVKIQEVLGGIEAVSMVPLQELAAKHTIAVGAKDIAKAIRQAHAHNRGQERMQVVIPGATHTDAILFMDLHARNLIEFVDPGEEMVFTAAKMKQAWALGGNLLATIKVTPKLRVHATEEVMRGAHVSARTTRIIKIN